MSRVSENSATNILKYQVNRTKSGLEELQLKGSTLKRMRKPSDDPLANIEALTIDSRISDNHQYLKNSGLATMQLHATEDALVQITELLMKAKELAIQHSSDFYDQDIRTNVSQEVIQLRNHALAIANKRVGNRYIFGGFNSLTPPFSADGTYNGDNGHITTEISKDFFIPVNLTGQEVFFFSDDSSSRQVNPLDEFPIFEDSRNKSLHEKDEKRLEENKKFIEEGRELASTDPGYIKNDVKIPEGYIRRENIFALLSMLTSALENDQSKVIQTLLGKFDESINRIITMRTKIGSYTRSVENATGANQMDTINGKTRKSDLVDADIAELFADITKQNDILETVYKANQMSLNKTLLDFLR